MIFTILSNGAEKYSISNVFPRFLSWLKLIESGLIVKLVPFTEGRGRISFFFREIWKYTFLRDCSVKCIENLTWEKRMSFHIVFKAIKVPTQVLPSMGLINIPSLFNNNSYWSRKQTNKTVFTNFKIVVLWGKDNESACT